MCEEPLGLICESNTCRCNGNTHFWNGKECQVKNGYGSECHSLSDCQDYNNLECTNHKCQ